MSVPLFLNSFNFRVPKLLEWAQRLKVFQPLPNCLTRQMTYSGIFKSHSIYVDLFGLFSLAFGVLLQIAWVLAFQENEI